MEHPPFCISRQQRFMIFSSNCTTNKKKKNHTNKKHQEIPFADPPETKKRTTKNEYTITRRMFSFGNTPKKTQHFPANPPTRWDRCLRLRGSTAEQQKATNRSSRFWWRQNDLKIPTIQRSNENGEEFEICNLEMGNFGWGFFFAKTFLAQLPDSPKKTLLIFLEGSVAKRFAAELPST